MSVSAPLLTVPASDLLNEVPAALEQKRSWRAWFYDQVEGPFDSPVEYFIL